MYIHGELSLRMAQIKIEEARSRAQRASAIRTASLDRRVSGAAAGTRRRGWSALMRATIGRSRARRKRLGAGAARTTRG